MGARILHGVEATGDGPTIKSGAKDHAVMVWFTNTGGSVTALTFTLQGRIRGDAAPEVWLDLHTAHVFDAGELTAKAALEVVSDKPMDEIRVNIGTLTETGTTAVYAEYKSDKN
jgi:hypothetical protein